MRLHPAFNLGDGKDEPFDNADSPLTCSVCKKPLRLLSALPRSGANCAKSKVNRYNANSSSIDPICITDKIWTTFGTLSNLTGSDQWRIGVTVQEETEIAKAASEECPVSLHESFHTEKQGFSISNHSV
ncbi:MAG: hypothetical protein R2941_24690 [Desulfobacterales bacterium]